MNSNITPIEADTKTDTSKKPIPLTIDTSMKYTIKNDDALKMSPEEFKRDEPKPVIRKRHYSISSHYSEYTPQLSPTSSVSSFSSNWSMDSRRSHVEEMIHLFEMGEKQQHRRYSMDSHTYKKPLYIRERKFEYNPIALEWKKRAHTIQLSESKSTYVYTVKFLSLSLYTYFLFSYDSPTKRRMNPIPEKSQSTWA